MLRKLKVILCLCLVLFTLCIPVAPALAAAPPAEGFEFLVVKNSRGVVTQKGFISCLYNFRERIAVTTMMLYSTQIPPTASGIMETPRVMNNIYGRMILGQYTALGVLAVNGVDLDKPDISNAFFPIRGGTKYYAVWSSRIPDIINIPSGSGGSLPLNAGPVGVALYDASVDDLDTALMGWGNKKVTNNLGQEQPGVLCVPDNNRRKVNSINNLMVAETQKAKLSGASFMQLWEKLEDVGKGLGTLVIIGGEILRQLVLPSAGYGY